MVTTELAKQQSTCGMEGGVVGVEALQAASTSLRSEVQVKRFAAHLCAQTELRA